MLLELYIARNVHIYEAITGNSTIVLICSTIGFNLSLIA